MAEGNPGGGSHPKNGFFSLYGCLSAVFTFYFSCAILKKTNGNSRGHTSGYKTFYIFVYCVFYVYSSLCCLLYMVYILHVYAHAPLFPCLPRLLYLLCLPGLPHLPCVLCVPRLMRFAGRMVYIAYIVYTAHIASTESHRRSERRAVFLYGCIKADQYRNTVIQQARREKRGGEENEENKKQGQTAERFCGEGKRAPSRVTPLCSGSGFWERFERAIEREREKERG